MSRIRIVIITAEIMARLIFLGYEVLISPSQLYCRPRICPRFSSVLSRQVAIEGDSITPRGRIFMRLEGREKFQSGETSLDR